MKDPAGEARRWWAQAVDDLAFVEWIKQEGRFFDKGCFIAQQAAEKALKACCYSTGSRFVPGHSTYELWESLVQTQGGFPDLGGACRRLDRFYIPTRYPNGLPGGVPASFFAQEDLAQALEDTRAVVEGVATWLTGRGVLEKRAKGDG